MWVKKNKIGTLCFMVIAGVQLKNRTLKSADNTEILSKSRILEAIVGYALTRNEFRSSTIAGYILIHRQ
jgi:hypothetical protein